jgi:hypothetical protein
MPPITAEEEFSKHKELKRENIAHLREWMLKQPHLPREVTGKLFPDWREISLKTATLLNAGCTS